MAFEKKSKCVYYDLGKRCSRCFRQVVSEFRWLISQVPLYTHLGLVSCNYMTIINTGQWLSCSRSWVWSHRWVPRRRGVWYDCVLMTQPGWPLETWHQTDPAPHTLTASYEWADWYQEESQVPNDEEERRRIRNRRRWRKKAQEQIKFLTVWAI